MKKIIFDLDNTLLFISKDWNNYYQSFIDKYKLSITSEELYSAIGCVEKDVKDTLVTKSFLIDFLNKRLSINMNEEKLDSFMNFYLDIPLIKIEEVYDVASYLSTKYELIAYSNWFVSSQTDRLRKAGILKFFSKIYGWDILPLKPSKQAIELIVGNDNIRDYIFIGDNIYTDLMIPDSLGINTIFYNRKRISQDKYKEVLEINELKKIL